jgi:uncharacterized protein (DUF697 family)
MAKWTETVKRVMDGDYREASEEERRDAVRDLIKVCSVASSVVAIQPIPFVDTALIAPIQIAMVQGIGRVHGFSLDKKSIIEMLSTFGASIVAQNVIMAAAKFIPFLGWAVSISMAYALTYAIGEVSDYYFRSGRGVSSSELQDMFKRVYQEKKKEKEQAHKGDDALKEKLDALNKAKAAGILTDDEYEKKKEELLAGF